MAAKKTSKKGARQKQKKHYAPDGTVCFPVMRMPGRKMVYCTEDGREFSKAEVTLK